MRKLCPLLLFLLAISLARAETSGAINFSSYNTTAPVTGLFGYTVANCDIDATCLGYKCFVDFDGEVDDSDTSKPSGTCRQATSPDCFNDNRFFRQGTNVKNTNVTYYTCLTNETGRWSALKSCASGETFGADSTEAGNCTAESSSSSSSGGGGGGSSSDSLKHSIRIVSGIADFDIVQGESAAKSARFRNDGNLTLTNITLALSGINESWYGSNPLRFSSINVAKEDQFNVTFFIPADAAVKSYSISAVITTHKSDVNASFSFALKVTPSNQTVETNLLPRYSGLLEALGALDLNVTLLASRGIDEGNITAAENLAAAIRSRLGEANLSLERKDYFSANSLLGEAEALLGDLRNMLASARPAGQPVDIVLITIAAFVVIIVLFVIYILLPKKTRIENK